MSMPWWSTRCDRHLTVNKFAEAFRLFGLTISLRKVDIIFETAPCYAALSSAISTDREEFRAVEDLKYVGTVFVQQWLPPQGEQSRNPQNQPST